VTSRMLDRVQAFRSENAAAAERLMVTAEALGKVRLPSELRPGWTIAAIFLHIAMWDRLVATRWLRVPSLGLTTPSRLDDEITDLVNDAVLPTWATVELPAAVSAAQEAAELVDRVVAELPAASVAAVLAEGRDRLIYRSVHRDEHLTELDVLLARAEARPD
jgi:hypothetical protein